MEITLVIRANHYFSYFNLYIVYYNYLSKSDPSVFLIHGLGVFVKKSNPNAK